MLKKSQRLLTDYEFRKVRKFGAKIKTFFFDVYCLETKSLETRFGIVVPNSFSKISVSRNRAKRVFREVLRLNLEKVKPGFWVVMYPRNTALNKGYEEINTEFNKILPTLPFFRKEGN